jgi:hypothetical protein
LIHVRARDGRSQHARDHGQGFAPPVDHVDFVSDVKLLRNETRFAFMDMYIVVLIVREQLTIQGKAGSY